MRIISGQFKSRRFTAPKHLPVRPTTDRAKEALFNILGHQYFLDELKVLDLFAGIGSISFEFASRGTTDITVVDQNRESIDFISKTAGELGIEFKTFIQDVFAFIAQNKGVYDIIFADPPYDLANEDFNKLIDSVFEFKRLQEDGILIVEHSKYTDLSAHPRYIEHRKYGSSVFSWFREKKEGTA
jgi:16S rRNA (guanine(966)-N(2))-methyltransferase RsmD